MILAHLRSVGLNEDALLSLDQSGCQQLLAKSQAYPAYWAKLSLSKALSNKRAAGAAACAVNFPAWIDMCHRLLEALSGDDYGYTK